MTGTSSIRKYRARAKFRAGAIAVAVLLMLAGATSYTAAQHKAAVDAKLQEFADNAALAGVYALAASEGQTDTSRLEAAHAAVANAIGPHAGIVSIISPSIDEMRMSVALTASETGRGVTATARYVQPGSAVSPGQTAAFNSRKRTRG